MTDEKNIVPQSNRGLLRSSDLIQRGVELARQFLARPARPRVEDILPGPFAWIEIPRGKTLLVYTDWGYEAIEVEVQPFAIAKYPVTNAQFAKFIEAGGYRERKWWTDAGWRAREEGWNYDEYSWMPSGTPWTEPRYWNDSKWNGADQPVVGVSWYEAVAFCLWLSDVTGEDIMLPTEEQWQYAAQGDDDRAFPWGNAWGGRRCNCSVDRYGSKGTTPVTHYEGKGDSYFGVVDMAGNVEEWCLTDYYNKTNDVNSTALERVLRGGSRYGNCTGNFRCDFRDASTPFSGLRYGGFRFARS